MSLRLVKIDDFLNIRYNLKPRHKIQSIIKVKEDASF